MWTPGHLLYKETANERGKEAGKEPLFSYAHFISKDIRYMAKKVLNVAAAEDWSHYHHHYKEQNPTDSIP